MFWKIILRIYHKLAFRLTLWYTAIFTVSLLGALFIIYFMIANVMQKHVDQGLLDDLYEVSATLALAGDGSFREALQIEAESDGIDKIFLRLLTPEGRIIAESDMKYWQTATINRGILNQIRAGEAHVFETQAVSPAHSLSRVIYGGEGAGKILQIGVPIEQENRIIVAFNTIVVPLMVFIILFSAMTGWFMANRALAGLGEVTKAASDIAKGAFDRRVQIKSKSEEIDLLASTFNHMLDHINDLMRGLKEVTDNIAHDLKTPITRMRMAAELELGKSGVDGDEQKMAAGIVEECDNLLQMIDTMLMISKEESGILDKEKERVDISCIIREAFELFSPVAEERGIQFKMNVPDDVVLRGDLKGLQRMIINLMENALKYTPSGGSVMVSSCIENDRVHIALCDSGIGIAAEDLPHIFKRLYRCEQSRSQDGFGLGLSLALAVARAHGGDIHVISELGKGSTFTVMLPCPSVV